MPAGAQPPDARQEVLEQARRALAEKLGTQESDTARVLFGPEPLGPPQGLTAPGSAQQARLPEPEIPLPPPVPELVVPPAAAPVASAKAPRRAPPSDIVDESAVPATGSTAVARRTGMAPAAGKPRPNKKSGRMATRMPERQAPRTIQLPRSLAPVGTGDSRLVHDLGGVVRTVGHGIADALACLGRPGCVSRNQAQSIATGAITGGAMTQTGSGAVAGAVAGALAAAPGSPRRPH